MFTAQEALAGRLVRSLHPPAELLPAARAIALEIAQNTSGVSVALNRQLLWRGLVADHPMQAHMADSRGILMMGQSADVKEGVASFLEKRAPHFAMSPSKELPGPLPLVRTAELPVGELTAKDAKSAKMFWGCLPLHVLAVPQKGLALWHPGG